MTRIHTTLLLCSIALSGCTAHFAADGPAGKLHTEAVRAGVADARAVVSRSRPFLRWDAPLLDRLDGEMERGDGAAAADLLGDAAALGLEIASAEARRLPPASVQELHPSGDRTDLRRALAQESAAAVAAEQDRLRAAGAGEVKRTLRELHGDLGPSVKEDGRTARTLAHLPFAPVNWMWLGWHIGHEYRGPNDVDFARVQIYVPPPAAANASALECFAPIVVQEWPDGRAYSPDADRVGTVGLRPGAPNGEEVVIDPATPSVYGYETQAILNGRPCTQLVYTWWYPEHPPSKRGDPEAGRIEGVTLRLTLGSGGQPRIAETVYNCGCYHRVFVDAELEAGARAQYGDPLPGKRFAVEKVTRRRIDLVVPELLRDLGGAEQGSSDLDRDLGGLASLAGSPLAVHVFARFHMIGAVRPHDSAAVAGRAESTTTYRLRPYEELELVPLGDRDGSMFQPDGLVRGAERREGMLLSGLGMLSAGQPRQRGTQLIHFDQYDFDDPRLLEKFLRLPDGL